MLGGNNDRPRWGRSACSMAGSPQRSSTMLEKDVRFVVQDDDFMLFGWQSDFGLGGRGPARALRAQGEGRLGGDEAEGAELTRLSKKSSSRGKNM